MTYPPDFVLLSETWPCLIHKTKQSERKYFYWNMHSANSPLSNFTWPLAHTYLPVMLLLTLTKTMTAVITRGAFSAVWSTFCNCFESFEACWALLWAPGVSLLSTHRALQVLQKCLKQTKLKVVGLLRKNTPVAPLLANNHICCS